MASEGSGGGGVSSGAAEQTEHELEKPSPSQSLLQRLKRLREWQERQREELMQVLSHTLTPDDSTLKGGTMLTRVPESPPQHPSPTSLPDSITALPMSKRVESDIVDSSGVESGLSLSSPQDQTPLSTTRKMNARNLQDIEEWPRHNPSSSLTLHPQQTSTDSPVEVNTLNSQDQQDQNTPSSIPFPQQQTPRNTTTKTDAQNSQDTSRQPEGNTSLTTQQTIQTKPTIQNSLEIKNKGKEAVLSSPLHQKQTVTNSPTKGDTQNSSNTIDQDEETVPSVPSSERLSMNSKAKVSALDTPHINDQEKDTTSSYSLPDDHLEEDKVGGITLNQRSESEESQTSITPGPSLSSEWPTSPMTSSEPSVSETSDCHENFSTSSTPFSTSEQNRRNSMKGDERDMKVGRYDTPLIHSNDSSSYQDSYRSSYSDNSVNHVKGTEYDGQPHTKRTPDSYRSSYSDNSVNHVKGTEYDGLPHTKRTPDSYQTSYSSYSDITSNDMNEGNMRESDYDRLTCKRTPDSYQSSYSSSYSDNPSNDMNEGNAREMEYHTPPTQETTRNSYHNSYSSYSDNPSNDMNERNMRETDYHTPLTHTQEGTLNSYHSSRTSYPSHDDYMNESMELFGLKQKPYRSEKYESPTVPRKEAVNKEAQGKGMKQDQEGKEPSRKSYFQTLMQQDNEEALNENPKPKRKFLKKGQGTSRFRMKPMRLRRPHTETTSGPNNQHSTPNDTTETSLEPYTVPSPTKRQFRLPLRNLQLRNVPQRPQGRSVDKQVYGSRQRNSVPQQSSDNRVRSPRVPGLENQRMEEDEEGRLGHKPPMSIQRSRTSAISTLENRQPNQDQLRHRTLLSRTSPSPGTQMLVSEMHKRQNEEVTRHKILASEPSQGPGTPVLANDMYKQQNKEGVRHQTLPSQPYQGYRSPIPVANREKQHKEIQRPHLAPQSQGPKPAPVIDIEKQQRKEDAELTAFERLEELAEDSSFSSNSSTVLNLLKQGQQSVSSTPLRNPPPFTLQETPVAGTLGLESRTLAESPLMVTDLINRLLPPQNPQGHTQGTIDVKEVLSQLKSIVRLEGHSISDVTESDLQSYLEGQSHHLFDAIPTSTPAPPEPSPGLQIPRVRFANEGEVMEYELSEEEDTLTEAASLDSDLITTSDLEALRHLNINDPTRPAQRQRTAEYFNPKDPGIPHTDTGSYAEDNESLDSDVTLTDHKEGQEEQPEQAGYEEEPVVLTFSPPPPRPVNSASNYIWSIFGKERDAQKRTAPKQLPKRSKKAEQPRGRPEQEVVVEDLKGQRDSQDLEAHKTLLLAKVAELEKETFAFKKENSKLRELQQQTQEERKKLEEERARVQEEAERDRRRFQEYVDRERNALWTERQRAIERPVQESPLEEQMMEVARLKDQVRETREEAERKESLHHFAVRKLNDRIKALESENQTLKDRNTAMQALEKENQELRVKLEQGRGGARSRLTHSTKPVQGKAMKAGTRPATVDGVARTISKMTKPQGVLREAQSKQKEDVVNNNVRSKECIDNLGGTGSDVGKERKKMRFQPQGTSSEESDRSKQITRTSQTADSDDVSSLRHGNQTLPRMGDIQTSHQNEPSQPLPSRTSPTDPPSTSQALVPLLGLGYSEEAGLEHTEKVREDGVKEVIYANGNRKEVHPTGDIMISFYNGDRKEIRDDRTVYVYGSDRTSHTMYTSGKEEFVFPNGQTETRNPDGSSEISFPNGSRKSVWSDGTEICTTMDGSVVRTNPDGSQVFEFPSGQREVHRGGEKRREYPDGTVKILHPDGRAETRYSTGRIRIKDKEGNVILDSRKTNLSSSLPS